MPSEKKITKSKKSGKKAQPKIIVFACSRTVEKNISDDRMQLKMPKGFDVIPIMCTGRMSVKIILNAIQNGADGVIVAGCKPDECRFGFGARHGVETVSQAQKLLHTLGKGEECVRYSGGRKIEEAYEEFLKNLSKIKNKK